MLPIMSWYILFYELIGRLVFKILLYLCLLSGTFMGGQVKYLTKGDYGGTATVNMEDKDKEKVKLFF